MRQDCITKSTAKNKTKIEKQCHREDWSFAKSVFKYSGIKCSLKSFQPFNAPVVVGILSAFLQEGVDVAIAKLLHIFRSGLVTIIIPT